MRPLILARLLVALVLGACAVQGCTLTVDTDELEAGDSALGCTAQQKVCHDADTGRGFCTSLDVPQYGCDDPGCDECVLVGVAVARCNSQNKCIKNQCKAGWQDCDDDGLDCETDTRDDSRNCGACDRVCDTTHSFNECVNSQCVLSGCSPGWFDCDDDVFNGCESQQSCSP
ncbi:MAG TPA: hypothetical protein VM686_10515 [Polyangiaceae bacterium]|jgi:hypothetical protein|nr:hypothetical protein [Polyangiaceae bacterium]